MNKSSVTNSHHLINNSDNVKTKNIKVEQKKSSNPSSISRRLILQRISFLTSISLILICAFLSLTNITESKKEEVFEITLDNNQKYSGQILDSSPIGKGQIVFSDNIKYVGYFENGIIPFTEKLHEESEFIGIDWNFKNDIFHFADGSIYQGNIILGKFSGKGLFSFANGSKYEGEFVQGLAHGKGVYFDYTGWKYEGEFLNGLKNGDGKIIYPDGKVVQGKFKDGSLI